MCGIVGQVRRERAVRRETLERMCAALEHRGPDARGILIDRQAGLGIQRLRVVDLVTGDQPIRNEDGSVAVVLNGEIYNFRALRRELAARGHRLATSGDTEVIVHLYEEHGPDCVRHLHGMFAFALWDSRRRLLLLARDRVGVKPLLYRLRDGELSFASEMAALLADPDVERDLDLDALDAYLAYGYVPAPHSILRSVRKLEPAHRLVLHDGRATIDRWWRLSHRPKLAVRDPRELHEPIRDAIRAATRRRLVSDVPIGAFLSGGVDSSAIVAAMAMESAEPVRTFSIGFDSAAHDELAHARRVARLYGTDHHELVVRPDAAAILPAIARHHGEPFADPSAIPTFHLASLARRHVTVALNGDGGDESFAGYTRYVSNRLAGRLDALPHGARRALGAGARRVCAGGLGRGGDGARAETSFARRAHRLASGLPLAPVDRYARSVSWFDAHARASLYGDRLRERLADATVATETIARRWPSAAGTDVLDSMLAVDVATYLPGDLLAKVDIATMAHGLEARSPLLDHELMELAARIPAPLKLRGTRKKWILREALRDWLPDETLDRPKQGFSVPIGDWLRDELAGHARELLLDRGSFVRGLFAPSAVAELLRRQASGADGDAKRVWSLLMLEHWHRELLAPAAVG